MSFAREGFPLIVIAALVAAGTYALALNRRSWPLWLLAFALTIAALCVAYFFSDPRPTGPGSERTAPVDAGLGVSAHREFAVSGSRRDRVRPISFSLNELNVPVERIRVTGR